MRALARQRALNHEIVGNATAAVLARTSPACARVVVVDYLVRSDGKGPNSCQAAAMFNHRTYAHVHGYAYRHVNTTKLTPGRVAFKTSAYFGKLVAMRALLREFERVFFLDLDAVVVDFSRRLEDVLPPDRTDTDLVFSGDTNMINSGVLL